MPTPSRGFVNSLKGLDPLLKVEWGDVINQWVISRKAQVPATEVEFLRTRKARLTRLIQAYEGHVNGMLKLQSTLFSVSEELKQAKVGRRIIMFTKVLNSKIYDLLVLSDMTRFGGYARVADKLEEEERKAELELERKQMEQRIAMNKETHDMLKHVWSKKANQLAHGERDMHYLLHGKRAEKGAPPLIQITDF